jgi:hypothetical protein
LDYNGKFIIGEALTLIYYDCNVAVKGILDGKGDDFNETVIAAMQ